MLEKFKKDSNNSFDVIIGNETTFDGDISAKGNMKIEGKVNGNLKSNGKIILGQDSIIEGNITSKSLIIGGNVNGNIKTAESLKITQTGNLEGDILVSSFAIEKGGTFKGQCDINTKDSNKKLKKLKEEVNKESKKETIEK
ncbi:MAG: bactofilin family protein [Bacillota bacterium]